MNKLLKSLCAALGLCCISASGASADTKIVTTPSGLRYEDTKVGTGAEAKTGDKVSVHYNGWLLITKEGKDTKGDKFDSSIDRGSPLEFTIGVGQVIPGWDEGIKGMKVGGKRTLFIPSKLAYGARAIGSIPANSDLTFDVELLGAQ